MKKAGNRQRGFTLIELVVVVTIIAVLAVVLIPTIVDVMERSRDRAARGTLVNIQKAMARFQQDTGYWPEGSGIWKWPDYGTLHGTLDETFVALRELPNDDPSLHRCPPGQTGVRCWNGPYLIQDLEYVRDPWGNKYRYFFLAPSIDWADKNYPSCNACDNSTAELPTGGLVIYSLGKDGLDGTACEAPVMDSCALEPLNLINGTPSVPDADDIIIVVSSSAI